MSAIDTTHFATHLATPQPSASSPPPASPGKSTGKSALSRMMKKSGSAATHMARDVAATTHNVAAATASAVVGKGTHAPMIPAEELARLRAASVEIAPPAPSLDAAHLLPPQLTKQEEHSFGAKWKKAAHAERRKGRSVTSMRPRPGARKPPLPGTHAEHKIECLVFKGGGAKGAIYPGAIKALEDAGVMPYVKRFAGASAGAVTAALLAAGLSAEQIYIELGSVNLHKLVMDSGNSIAQGRDLYTRYGMNPGDALFKHLGILFQRYLGCADITFAQLWKCYNVELAVAVTNISRAAVELLHAKTAPNYPIRRAVRMSMSLPVALVPCLARNIHSVVSEPISRLNREMQRARELQQRARDSQAAGGAPEPAGAIGDDAPTLQMAREAGAAGDGTTNSGGGDEDDVLEYYVDGGVLNNYPIDCFDGWWLSMDKEHQFFKMVVCSGGHTNYVERHGAHNSRTIGFRLSSAHEPDAMHSRLGNDNIEIKVRGTVASYLPNTPLARAYSTERDELTEEAKKRFNLTNDLRASMDWIKSMREDATKAIKPSGGGGQETLDARLEHAPPAAELLSALGVDTKEEMLDILSKHHRHAAGYLAMDSAPPRTPTVSELVAAIKQRPELKYEIQAVYDRAELDDFSKLTTIQHLVLREGATRNGDELPDVLTACDELEQLLEAKGEDIMKRLCGMEPKHIGSVYVFINRLIEAIQMTNDERVQTKENYSRTCTLNTEYVGTMSFTLEEEDNEFLWRKGYLTTKYWLDRRSDKTKKKKKAAAAALAKELKAQAAAEKAKEAASGASTAPQPPPPAPVEEEANEGGAPLNDLRKKVRNVLSSKVMSDADKLIVIEKLMSARSRASILARASSMVTTIKPPLGAPPPPSKEAQQ